jgi:hypothetical protein
MRVTSTGSESLGRLEDLKHQPIIGTDIAPPHTRCRANFGKCARRPFVAADNVKDGRKDGIALADRLTVLELFESLHPLVCPESHFLCIFIQEMKEKLVS